MKLFGRFDTNTPTPPPTASDPKVWLGEDGILRVDYGESACIDAEMIEKVYTLHMALTTKPVPVMFFGHGRPSSTKSGRDASKSAKVCAATTAIAFITKSWYIRQLLDLYLTFERPPYPAFVCETEEDAADWLKRYLTPDQ